MDEAGKDASKAFDEVGHTSDARTVLTKYKIGELPEVREIKLFCSFILCFLLTENFYSINIKCELFEVYTD